MGLSTAILASACCAPPVLLATLGLATSSILLAWVELKPLFLALAAVLLVAGLATSVARGRSACATSHSRRPLWLYPLITVVSFGIGYWLLMGITTPRLYARVFAADRAAVSHRGVVVEPDGRTVALHRATIGVNPGCDGCAVTLRQVLSGLPGVHAAAIDVERSAAIVVYDPTRTNVRTIEGKIPYRWFFAPRLRRDVALAVPSLLSASTVQPGSTFLVLVTVCGLAALTSVAAWGVPARFR